MKNILLFLVLLLPLSGCDCSTEPSLEERFSCKVDGKLFVAAPDGTGLWPVRNVTIEHYNSGAEPSRFLSVGASSDDTTGIYGISFACDSVMKINTPYPILKSGGVDEYRGAIFSTILQGTLTLSQLNGGVIAGTFNFTAKERGGTRIVTVTDGRFNTWVMSR